MSEVAGHHVRQAPRKRTDDVQIADLTMLVRVPGQPAGVRVFTDDEEVEAAEYAARTGGEIVALPLPLPNSYVAWCEAVGGDDAQ